MIKKIWNEALSHLNPALPVLRSFLAAPRVRLLSCSSLNNFLLSNEFCVWWWLAIFKLKAKGKKYTPLLVESLNDDLWDGGFRSTQYFITRIGPGNRKVCGQSWLLINIVYRSYLHFRNWLNGITNSNAGYSSIIFVNLHKICIKRSGICPASKTRKSRRDVMIVKLPRVWTPIIPKGCNYYRSNHTSSI